MMMMMVVSVTV